MTDLTSQLIGNGKTKSLRIRPRPQPRLSLCRKLLFGLAAPPLQMTSNICGFFFSIYLLEAVRLSPAQVSAITFAGRLWDAATDPLVGQLVLRTRTRCGRTKPWLAAATALGPAAFLAMWLSGSAGSAFSYHLLSYLAYCACITCYHVPYASSTMLISNSAEDKDGATACRIGFELLFTIIGTGVFGAVSGRHRLAADCGAGDSGGADSPELLQAERRGYALAALVIAGIYFACGLFATFGIRERVRLDARRDSLLSNVRSVLAFRPYVLLMLAFLCMSLGIQTVQANLGLYTTHSLGMGGHMNSGIFTVLTVAVLLVPFWARMSGRFGKKRIFMIGLLPQLPCLMLATALPPNSVAASGRGGGANSRLRENGANTRIL
ncbi:hypothetical protein BOX15_Mlig021662g1 [Macrostomum lignano]|uniref:MFS domain-containing protein n=1 Tax=Macrostomum lignano TaxID=282301 RepID=A0A267DZG9_9PLAT|nr:hypothetical protein BOX15_Mlig021662g1 [Macrostomum lignano]